MSANLAQTFDHTLLKPDGTEEQIVRLCSEAKEHGFYAVCIHPTWVRKASELLRESSVKVCTVISFPLGAATPETKAWEAQNAIKNGAHEVDMVINIGRLKDADDRAVEADIRSVVAEADGQALVKVIIETCLLTDDEKVRACELAVNAGADYVKTSTGFSSGGATVADIRLMRRTVGPDIGVKASGGIRDRKTAEAMLEAGATRIGASSGVSIVKGETGRTSY